MGFETPIEGFRTLAPGGQSEYISEQKPSDSERLHEAAANENCITETQPERGQNTFVRSENVKGMQIIDPDLAILVDAWLGLPKNIRAAIMRLIDRD